MRENLDVKVYILNSQEPTLLSQWCSAPADPESVATYFLSWKSRDCKSHCAEGLSRGMDAIFVSHWDKKNTFVTLQVFVSEIILVPQWVVHGFLDQGLLHLCPRTATVRSSEGPLWGEGVENAVYCIKGWPRMLLRMLLREERPRDGETALLMLEVPKPQ